jgi:hypothetical protein
MTAFEVIKQTLLEFAYEPEAFNLARREVA